MVSLAGVLLILYAVLSFSNLAVNSFFCFWRIAASLNFPSLSKSSICFFKSLIVCKAIGWLFSVFVRLSLDFSGVANTSPITLSLTSLAVELLSLFSLKLISNPPPW